MAQKILIADDSIASQRLFEKVLIREGYDVTIAGSGAEALDRVKEQQPDIALIDAIMPEVDGYRVCETLQQQPGFQNVPIIMLTGVHEEFNKEKGVQLVGEQAILTKPAKSQTIVSKVKELLEQQQAESAPQAEDRAGVIEEPPLVEEEYAFDEDSEELDMVVEDEILEDEAEFEEEIEEFEEEAEEVEGPLDESWKEEAEALATPVVEEPSAPEPPVAPQPPVAEEKREIPDEKLDMIVNDMAERLAGKLVPMLVQELAQSLMHIPIVKDALEETSKKLVKEMLPEIRKKL